MRIRLEHGPLVYALGVKEEWNSKVTPKWSTPKFPEWDATPASAWNYGIAVEENQLAVRAKVERVPMTDDPWVDPPVRLIVPMRKLPGWTLRVDPKFPERRYTPPLPDSAKSDSGLEQVPLVPYGATHLRVSIFPQAFPKA